MKKLMLFAMQEWDQEVQVKSKANKLSVSLSSSFSAWVVVLGEGERQ